MYTLGMKNINTPSPHYSILIENHLTQEQLNVELFDTPFVSRRFELRINGTRPPKYLYATKTQLWDRLRKWMVSHE